MEALTGIGQRCASCFDFVPVLDCSFVMRWTYTWLSLYLIIMHATSTFFLCTLDVPARVTWLFNLVDMPIARGTCQVHKSCIDSAVSGIHITLYLSQQRVQSMVTLRVRSDMCSVHRKKLWNGQRLDTMV